MFDGPFLIKIAVRPLKLKHVKLSFVHIVLCAPVVFSNTEGGIDRVESMWCVSKLPRILLKKSVMQYHPHFFQSVVKVLSEHLHLVQHQGLNTLKRSQKRLSATGQKSCSHQGGV